MLHVTRRRGRADQCHHLEQLGPGGALPRRLPTLCYFDQLWRLVPRKRQRTAQWTNLGVGAGDRFQGNSDGDNGGLRWNYSDLSVGTCKESLNGDNHFRWYLQNGTDDFTGAIFLAVSMEEWVKLAHKVQRDGYDRGRD
ncbi:hypothetical protein ACQY0O_002506 [Thecaphora frezii]